jgi:sec-independent protein translocase protein TatC
MLRPPHRLGHDQHADLVEHLDELRTRVVICLVAVAAGFGVAYAFHGRLIAFLNRALPVEHRHPVTLGIAEPFITSMKISLVAGLALALPIVLWQVWSYLAPAFEQHVQRTVAGLVVAATGLFAVGVAFSDRVALPAAVHFLTSYDDNIYNIQVRAQDYYSFAIMVLAAVGLVFELPIFVLALVRLGVTSSAKLRKNRRIGYVVVAALAVALPGVDPVTTLFEMVPLLILFESSIWLSVALERHLAKAKTRPRASSAPA